MVDILEEEQSILSSQKELIINLDSKIVSISGKIVQLTPLEFELLLYLARNNKRTVEHKELLGMVWKCLEGGTLDQIRSCIKRIRKKINANTYQGQHILTIRGWGYRLCRFKIIPYDDSIIQ